MVAKKYHKKHQNRVYTQTKTNRYNKPLISTQYKGVIKHKNLQSKHNRNKNFMYAANKHKTYVQHKNYKAKINTVKNKDSNTLSQRKVKKSNVMAKRSVTKKINTKKYLAKK
jgi:delta 1-pyrroline-5-carboxylate dehydrogenase